MKKYYLLILFLLVLPSVTAAVVVNDTEARWRFENNYVDSNNTYNLTSGGSGNTFTAGYEGDYALDVSGAGWAEYAGSVFGTGNPSWSVTAWVRPDDCGVGGTESTIIGSGAFGSANRQAVFMVDTNCYMGYRGWANDVTTTTNPLNLTEDAFVSAVFNASTNNVSFYLNAVNFENLSLPSTQNLVDTITVVGSNLGKANQFWDGAIDDLRVYRRAITAAEVIEIYENINSSGGAPPATPTAAERVQQDASIEQNATVTVNSINYVPIMSSSVTLSTNSWVYGSATVPITPTASNTASCRLTVDGSELNETMTNRSLTAGSAGNMLITSLEHYVTSGAHTFGLECLRVGGGQYTVGNASILLHILTTPAGSPLETAQLNFSSSTLPGLLGSTTITTTDNYTASGLNRYLVTEWAASYSYGATGNISVITELAGTNCTEVKRYGTSGSTGSVGGLCYVGVGNETNATTYDFKVYGTGTGSVTNAKFHIKEFILHDDEINQTSLNGLTGDGTIASIDVVVNAAHSTPDLVSQAILSVLTTSGTATGTFYLTADSQNSTFVSRTSSAGQPGVLGIQKDIKTITGTTTLSLVGNCPNCTFTGQNLMAYISGDIAATPNEFIVTAHNIYDNTAFSQFSINLSDGRSFSTTTGSIVVPATGQFLNVTSVENGVAPIPHFENTTLNHNSTYDLQLNLTPYTILNATFGGAKVNNFTVNGTTTTSGTVYTRLFNSTVNYTITNAVSSGGTNLSDQSANVTASPYLESYTFVMLTANAFNFSIYDEITEALVTENMTIELIAGATAGTYTTTNGTLYLDLLTPSDYTIRYYSTSGSNYTQRDYIQTLTDRQRYEIDLYGIENDEATDMIVTIKDTSGDPIEGAIVKLLRYYTSCNCYNVVEMATTSVAGTAYFVVDAYDGHYKFAVEYQGETEFLSTSPENFIPSNGLVSRTITINLGSAYFQSFRALTDVARTLTYNNDTKGLSFTWNDPSGLVNKGCLYAEYLNGVHYTAVTPVCQEAATGSVVLTLNNSANSFKYYAELETSTSYSDVVVFSGVIEEIRANLLGGNVGLGAFLAAGVMAVLALMFSFSAIAVMVITAVGVVVMSFLGFATIATAFITGFVTLIIGLAAYLMRS